MIHQRFLVFVLVALSVLARAQHDLSNAYAAWEITPAFEDPLHADLDDVNAVMSGAMPSSDLSRGERTGHLLAARSPSGTVPAADRHPLPLATPLPRPSRSPPVA